MTDLLERFLTVRRATESLCSPLAIEDYVVQSMPDASPTRWHLAHTAWFFETFLLSPELQGYRSPDPAYSQLFNSYYNGVGAAYPRARRGLLTRPTVDDVFEYRAHVDLHVQQLLEGATAAQLQRLAPVLELGLHHEQQHQELILTDIKHVLAQNPLFPVYHSAPRPTGERRAPAVQWFDFDPGLYDIGFDHEGFSFDNETPRHAVWIHPFALASRLVTNAELLAFIQDGGYTHPALWLSDGWATVQREGWSAPLYWVEQDGEFFEFTLHGLIHLDPHAPACHLSYYEADAFATWADARLPTEAEWEVIASSAPTVGNFASEGLLHPRVAAPDGIQQLYGDVWEWTSSPYVAYPGYKPLPGALGEYNGKFMCNQLVLRGGSCATPAGHLRPTYRNFFPPHARWQFSGLRLARDLAP